MLLSFPQIPDEPNIILQVARGGPGARSADDYCSREYSRTTQVPLLEMTFGQRSPLRRMAL